MVSRRKAHSIILVVNPVGQIRKEYFRIPILFILIGIKSHLYNMIIRNLSLPEILSEQLKKQIRFPASANSGNDLDQPLIALGNQFIQIGVPADFHFHHPRLLMIQKCGFCIFIHFQHLFDRLFSCVICDFVPLFRNMPVNSNDCFSFGSTGLYLVQSFIYLIQTEYSINRSRREAHNRHRTQTSCSPGNEHGFSRL